jgi:hypothetical protein
MKTQQGKLHKRSTNFEKGLMPGPGHQTTEAQIFLELQFYTSTKGSVEKKSDRE